MGLIRGRVQKLLDSIDHTPALLQNFLNPPLLFFTVLYAWRIDTNLYKFKIEHDVINVNKIDKIQHTHRRRRKVSTSIYRHCRKYNMKESSITTNETHLL